MYRTEPTEALIKEMDALVDQSLETVRGVLRAHAGKVDALASMLLDREELDAEAVSAILGPRPETGDEEREEK